jgi:hypothetical protein
MSVSVTVNGIAYTLPSTGETDWGANVTSWMQALSAASLQKNGGTFALTADVDFGGSFGLKSLYYKSRTANIATAGQVRLARADTVSWRNEANGADLALGPDSGNVLEFNGVDLVDVSTAQTVTNKTLTAINLKDSTRAYARATTAAGQALTDATFTIIDFGTVERDTRSAITTGAAWKYTIPSGHAGIYQVSVAVQYAAGTAGIAEVALYKNGVAYATLARVGSNAVVTTHSATTTINLAAADYIDVRAYRDGGGARSLTAFAVANWISITRLVTDL